VTHRAEHLDLCAGYVLGNLSEADLRILERHLDEGCPDCERALAELGDASVLLAASAPPARPSEALKRRVLAGLRDARTAEPGAARPSHRRAIVEYPRRPAFGFTSWAWAAAAAALAIATGLSWNTATRLRSELDASRQRLTELEQRLEEERRWAAVLGSPDARVAELTLTPQGIAQLRARATYDPRTRSAVIVVDNFQAPAGNDYELWAMRPQGVASLGLIKTDESGHGVIRLENVGGPAEVAGFAISLEPAGGSPNKSAPSGPVVMAGRLGG
jgi:anti-sigma-K factor RskA